MATPVRLLAFLLVAGLVTPVATLAQIERHNGNPAVAGLVQQGEWIPGYGLPGVSGDVAALAVADDRLFVGGFFFVAGNELAFRLAQFSMSEQKWSAVGEGINGNVHAIATASDGAVYIGGAFTLADGLEANRIAHYDPDTGTWSPLDAGMDGPVHALAVGDDGTLYAAGDFSTAGVVPAGGIAAWDGESWSSLGDVSGVIRQLSFLGGKLYAGGNFSAIGGLQVSHVAAYDPVSASWSGLGQGVDGRVRAMATWGSWLWVGGTFNNAFQSDGTAVPSPRVARWDPLLQTWSPAGLDGYVVSTLGVDHQGVPYVGGESPDVGFEFARLIGKTWEPIGLQSLPYWALRYPSQIVSVGDRLAIGLTGYRLPDGNPDPAQFLYSFDPGTDEWGVFAEPIRGGVDQTITVLAGDAAGGLYAAGDFKFAGPVAASGLAYLSPTDVWETLGGGVVGSPGAWIPVRALLVRGDGSAYVGGWFHTAIQPDGQEVSAFGIARWDRAAGEWSPLGGGVQMPSGSHGSVDAMAHGADGSVLVGGAIFQVEQPDGEVLPADRLVRWRPGEAQWETFPADHGLHRIRAIAEAAGGTIYVLGEVVPAGGLPDGRLVRLPPGASEWELVREWPSEEAHDLALWGDPGSADGALYVSVSDAVWRWSDGNWQSIGGPGWGLSLTLNGVPGVNGLLYAGASPGINQAGPWQWDGAEWSLFEGSVISSGDSPHIFALDLVPDGEGTASLWVGGYFARAGEHASGGLARWVTQDYTTSTDETPSTPEALGLTLYPNPLSQTGTVELILPAAADVQVTVYDLLGRRVSRLLDEHRPAGVHRLEFSAADLASGTYVVRLSAGNETRAVLMTRVE